MSDEEKSTIETITIDGVEYYDIVSQKYRLDPETDDLIYGDALENGMVVLSEDGRYSEKAVAGGYTTNLPVVNRWCEVTQVRGEEDGVYFIALYADGHKTVRGTSETSGWLVKKASIPKREIARETMLNDQLDRHFDTHAEPRTVHGVFEI